MASREGRKEFDGRRADVHFSIVENEVLDVEGCAYEPRSPPCGIAASCSRRAPKRSSRPPELRGVMGRRPLAQTTRTPVIVSATWTAILSRLSAYADQHVVVNAKLPVQIQPTFHEPELPAFDFPSGGTVGSVGTDPGLSSSGARSCRIRRRRRWRCGPRPRELLVLVSPGRGRRDPPFEVNASALAATCMVESQFPNVGVTTGASYGAGASQMINSTYTADINGAMAEDPSIAGSTCRPNDPGPRPHAAAYELGAGRTSTSGYRDKQSDGA